MNVLYTCLIFFIVACQYEDCNAMKGLMNRLLPSKSDTGSSSSKSKKQAYEQMDSNVRDVLYTEEVAGITTCLRTCFSSLQDAYNRYELNFPDWETWLNGLQEKCNDNGELGINVAKKWLVKGAKNITKNNGVKAQGCDDIINTAKQCIGGTLGDDLDSRLFDDILERLSKALQYGKLYDER